jgi:ribonucleoside-triphosphate reductase
MNEAIENFTHGKENISTPWGEAFALDILDYMRTILKEYQEETGNMYNLEATPAE